MTGTASCSIAVTESWRCLTSTRARRALEACERGWPPPPAGRTPPIVLRSSPTEKCGPRAAITSTRTSASSLIAWQARGRSFHRSVPMALRASGRSSHSVAICPSTSRLSTGDVNSSTAVIEPSSVGPGQSRHQIDPDSYPTLRAPERLAPRADCLMPCSRRYVPESRPMPDEPQGRSPVARQAAHEWWRDAVVYEIPIESPPNPRNVPPHPMGAAPCR